MSWLNFTSSATLSLPAAATAGNGYLLVVRAGSGVTITVDPDGTETVDGVSTISVGALDWCLLFCDGTAWVSLLTQNFGGTALNDPTLLRPVAGSIRENISVANVSGAQAMDLASQNYFAYTLTGNATLSFSNVPSSGVVIAVTVELIQDGTGSRTVTWPGSVKWPGGVAPVLTTTAGKIDVVTLITRDGGTSWLGFVAGQNF
jgi:hypothetical protein